ncbi:MAG: NADH-quinone oxidoreductase subunit NuoF [Dehalococcoidales bacterium]|nr:NADH-quinone oxidoreductase subunit NuoF [Dehalococcoidales bacterium]
MGGLIMKRITSELELKELRDEVKPELDIRSDGTFNKDAQEVVVRVCMESSCIGSGSEKVLAEFERLISEYNGNKPVKAVGSVPTGCHGLCEIGPSVIVNPGNILYAKVKPEDAAEIFEKHMLNGEIVERLLYRDPQTGEVSKSFEEVNFFKNQTKRVLSKNPLMNPWKMEDYIGLGGYQALFKALKTMTPEEVLEVVRASGLRGRGGAGFPTGTKWGFVRSAKSDTKYVVCNGDEGDPGAYMDRSVLEGNPHSVIEGMIIGAYTIGNVKQGYAYIRAEYPYAIKKMEKAIEQAKEAGFLGKDILGTGMDFDIDIFPGAGAFVCGEETALLSSIEGKMGRPRQRPPFPANVGGGLFGQPTTINNVETWSNIPEIVLQGADIFTKYGTEKATGTKTFSLVGKINNTGLVEVPMGTPISKIIYEIGGGVPNGKKLKGVQMGGPSGGVVPASKLDTTVDYDALTQIGAIVGSGGMVVIDEDSCMVDVAKYFLDFTKDESCGKCVPCREGIPQMMSILEKITSGKAKMEDLDKLESLAMMIKTASLCALGQTAPNPVLSTIRHFRDEYEAHIKDKKCVAGVCKDLIEYWIDPEKCKACGVCLKNCPYDAITGEKKVAHVINTDLCQKCGVCMTVCKFDAVQTR